MNYVVRVFMVGCSALFLGACGSDDRPVQSPPGRSIAPVTAETHVRQDQTRQTSPGANTVTGIQLDSTLASACNIPAPRAFFEFDSALVREQVKGTLEEVATCLTDGPLKGQRIEIVGHTDPRGTDQYNAQLGKSRAESVSEYLVNQGMDKAKINTTSKGESMSTATDEHGYAYERRVNIRLAQ